jgi:hypothetical protein
MSEAGRTFVHIDMILRHRFALRNPICLTEPKLERSGAPARVFTRPGPLVVGRHPGFHRRGHHAGERSLLEAGQLGVEGDGLLASPSGWSR